MHEHYRSKQLQERGYLGSNQDMWKEWLAARGFTGTIADAEKDWLSSQGFTGTLVDQYYELYTSSGLTGSLDDMGKKWLLPADPIPGPVEELTFTATLGVNGVGVENVGIIPYPYIEYIASSGGVTKLYVDNPGTPLEWIAMIVNGVRYESENVDIGIGYESCDFPVELIAGVEYTISFVY